MKAGHFIAVWVFVLLSAATGAYAATRDAGGAGYIGIRMDPAPLPRLLSKHLGLSRGQGVRIQNVDAGTPADEAGLERDDIIIEFEGRAVQAPGALAEVVQRLEPGTEVSLVVIHLGKRKTVRLKLGSFSGRFKPKYPPEPAVIGPLDPGRILRFRPGDEWLESGPPGRLDVDIDVGGSSNQLYTYNYSKDGRTCTVVIRGDPQDEDAELIVWVDGDRRETTVGQMDRLPDKHREVAEEALKNARRSRRTGPEPGAEPPAPRRFPHIRPWLDWYKRDWPGPSLAPRFGPHKDVLDRLEEQLRQLQERVRKLEERLGDKAGSANRNTGQDEATDTAGADDDQMV